MSKTPAKNKLPSLEILEDRLDYDPFTGVFKWKKNMLNNKIKKETGLKKYRKGIGLDSDFSCTLHKVKEGFTKYTFNIIDRDDNVEVDVIEKEWDAVVDNGFDITLLIAGADPFNPE